MKFILLLKKIFWATINISSPSISLCAEQWITQHISCAKDGLLVITINYDKFLNRDIKKIRPGFVYPCGELLLEKCRDLARKKNIPFLELITTDNVDLCDDNPIACNTKKFIYNDGTDIGAIQRVSEFLKSYRDVIVVNSSADARDAAVFEKMLNLAINKKEELPDYFVIGPNANSIISPSFPLLFGHNNPHIITNFFYTQTELVIHVIEHAKSNGILNFLGGLGNKYIAIRYFEVFLSKFVLSIKGRIFQMSETALISYENDSDRWPKKDSRLGKKL